MSQVPGRARAVTSRALDAGQGVRLNGDGGGLAARRTRTQTRANFGSPPSVITSGASRPVRREAYWRQRAGMGAQGSIGYPAASASRCAQVRGTTSSTYPPPRSAASGRRPPRGPADGSRRARPPRVDRQLQASHRVEPVTITAVLADQDLRPERPQQRRHHGVEGTQPPGVGGPGRERHVHRRSPRPRPASDGSRCRGTPSPDARAG